MNIHAALARHLHGHATPGEAVLQAPDAQWTARDLLAQCARHAGLLRAQGLAPGARVLVRSADSATVFALYLACLGEGLVCVPLSLRWPAGELAWFVEDADPALIICTAGDLPALSRLRPGRVFTLDSAAGKACGSWMDALPATAPQAGESPAPAHPALILYSAGTDGTRAHGALVGHARLQAHAAAIAERWAIQAGDRVLQALPLFSMPGLCLAHATLVAGGRLTLAPGLGSEAPALARRQLALATVLLADPRTYLALLQHAELTAADTRGIRLFGATGAGLRRATAEAWAERFGLAPRQCYGSGDAGLVTADYPDERGRIGTVGKVLAGRRLRSAGSNLKPMPIEHLGEIQLPEFEGWWGRPDSAALTADGWLRSGDIGMYDEDDYISLCGRTANRFVSGYYTIDPDVIEAVIETLPGVAETAVIDVPHAALGAQMLALVVAQPGATLSPEDLLAQLRERLPHHLVPHRLRLLQELPRHPLGPVLRGPLRKRFAMG